MMYQDIAGLVPRMDDQVELWPIDVGLDHFAVDNLSYHGSDLTIVWQKPGGPTYYPTAPFGYSLYVNGQRAFTLDDLVHVTWQSSTGAVNLAVAGDTQVLFQAAVAMLTADQVDVVHHHQPGRPGDQPGERGGRLHHQRPAGHLGRVRRYTYRAPSSYTVQFFNGSTWVDVSNQVRTPATPAPNLNEVTFTPVTTQLVRVLVTRQTGFGVGSKELQVF